MSRESKSKPSYTPGEVICTEMVVVRTYSAGVHIGYLHRQDGTEVVLTEARRIWEWEGAFTLNEVSQQGISKGKISKLVPWIKLLEAIEILPLTDTAFKTIVKHEHEI